MNIVKKAIEKQKLYKNRFLLDDSVSRFFDIKYNCYKTEKEISRSLEINIRDLNTDIWNKKIPKYNWFCYLDWNIEWYYNLFDKDLLAKPSNNPRLSKWIEYLISNICWWNEEDMNYVYKSIIYKYTHINDFLIPALVTIWRQWTWKWWFIDLITAIFNIKNCELWLNQNNIESRFSNFKWDKLILEYKEITNTDKKKWKENMWVLKSKIMEKNIQVERKGIDTWMLKSIVWYIISSNDDVPLQLDDPSKWNRRFSFVKWTRELPVDEANLFYESIWKNEDISDFIAWLFKKFPDIEKEKRLMSHDNEIKRNIEKMCESIWNAFFWWFEKKFPNIKKISCIERRYFLNIYKNEMWEDYNSREYTVDKFHEALSHRYILKSVRIRWKVFKWYEIQKEVEWEWFFTQDITITKWDSDFNN